MRAARLLQILLMLQNRGRLTAPALAALLEVTPRTILRDVEAMTEAGLPVLTHRGPLGGIELGFGYRTRLTGLSTGEAEALAVWLSAIPAELVALGLGTAARQARDKLLEGFPERTRAVMAEASWRFSRRTPPTQADPRLAAVAGAIRSGQTLHLRADQPHPIVLRPTHLSFGPDGWAVSGPPLAAPVPVSDWGNITIAREPAAAGPLPFDR